jgi:starch phosphorylase
VLDGWWVEGCLEGVTGWAVGEDGGRPSEPAREAASLYDKLEHVVAPLFFGRPLAFAEVMRAAVALNASYYNAQRMVVQYLRNAYLTAATDTPDGHPDTLIQALAPFLTAPPASGVRPAVP